MSVEPVHLSLSSSSNHCIFFDFFFYIELEDVMNLLSETSEYQPNNSVLLRALSNVKMVMKFLYLLYLCNYNPPLNTSPYHIETLDYQSPKGRSCSFYYVTTFIKKTWCNFNQWLENKQNHAL